MAIRRKVDNLLALPLLVLWSERPMHPYEAGSQLRARGKDLSIKINWGSLYTVVQNLHKHGFIEPAESVREGRKPERTVYRITPAGRAEMLDWLRELLAVPEREYPRFEAALSDMAALHPDEVMDLLQRRLEALDADLAAQRAALDQAAATLPRLFLLETEYHLAISTAEAEWARALLSDMRSGALPGLDGWRVYRETGEMPSDLADLAAKELPADD